ncbi:MAG: beta-galactosidase, partial [Cyclobacteriaceae bacterium]
MKASGMSMNLFVLVIAFSYAGTLPAQQKPAYNKGEFFPFSVWYSGGKARATMLSSITPKSKDEWRQDVQQIKSLGFNSIKTWVEWSHCEPRKGAYNFENLKMILSLAQEAGLKVIIQMYAESAPEWLGKEFPTALFEAHSGDKVQPQVAPGYCVDNQGVRAAFTRFYEETAKIAVLYPNFYGWDLWSEPHIVQWGSPGWIENAQYCFCPHTQDRFRQWLKKKYASLEELNTSWYRNFEKWEDVQAPRFGTILTYSDFMDWKHFMYEKMAADLGLRYGAVRNIDKTHVATAHASPVSLFSSPYGSGAEDDFLMSEQVDFYGVSQYPKHNQPGDWTPWRFMAAGDFSYSANKGNEGYYVGEFQAGFGTVGLNVSDPVTPADHRIWTWSSLATGAKGIFTYAYYPMSSGYESGGYGLVNLDGTSTERSVELGKLARLIDDHKVLFAASKPVKAEIALLYNPLAQMVGGTRRVGTQDGHTNSLIGYYRYLTDQNIPLDFIHRKDLETGDLSQYKLILAPYALMLTQTAADGLKNFIDKGGYAFSEARLGWNDNRGFTSSVIPGLGLSEVFGIRETKVSTLPKVVIKVQDNSHPVTAHLNRDDIIEGSLFAESVEPLKNNTNIKVLGRLEDGTPCIVTSDFGKGRTLYVGSFLAMANSRGSLWDQSTQRLTVQDSANRNTNQFLLGLIDWANIRRPFTSTQPGKTNNPLVVRLHENDDSYLLYILNHGRSTEKTTIALTVREKGEYVLEEIIKNRKVNIAARDLMLEFTTDDIGEKEVSVWTIRRK